MCYIYRKRKYRNDQSLKPTDSLFNWKLKPNTALPKVYFEMLRHSSPSPTRDRELSLSSLDTTPPRDRPVPVRPAVDPLTPRSRSARTRMTSVSPSRADGDRDHDHTPRTRVRTPRTPRTRRREDTYLCRLGCDDRRHFASESSRNHHENHYCRLNEV